MGSCSQKEPSHEFRLAGNLHSRLSHPQSLATRFKFLKEILPVSSSSKSRKALRISSFLAVPGRLWHGTHCSDKAQGRRAADLGSGSCGSSSSGTSERPLVRGQTDRQTGRQADRQTDDSSSEEMQRERERAIERERAGRCEKREECGDPSLPRSSSYPMVPLPSSSTSEIIF